jgi:ligand-binding SRPBCC domain-containing protein
MKTLEFTTLIDTTQEELFKFHTDSNNITKITPPNIKVELLNNDTITYEEKIVKIKTTKFFIPTYWEVKIEKLENPNILIDLALKSPFKYWKHHHIFTKQNDGCELKDIIEFELPFGFLGKVIEPLIEYDIKSMFIHRHQKTKEILENYKELGNV